jgi:hypothetical protein
MPNTALRPLLEICRPDVVESRHPAIHGYTLLGRLRHWPVAKKLCQSRGMQKQLMVVAVVAASAATPAFAASDADCQAEGAGIGGTLGGGTGLLNGLGLLAIPGSAP